MLFQQRIQKRFKFSPIKDFEKNEMVSIEEIDEGKRDFWDVEISRFENAHPLNAYGWGKVRAIDGWVPTYLMARRGSNTTGAIMLLRKKIPLLGMSIMYAPRGPVWDLSDTETLRALLSRARKEAIRYKAIFLRIDPNIRESDLVNYSDTFAKEGFIHLEHRWTYWNTPRDVYRIDLTRASTTDELFNSFYRAARKAYRKAMKQEILIKKADSLEELFVFCRLFKEFSIEKGFMARGYEYQRRLWDEFVSRGNGNLFLAICQQQVVGGLLVLTFAGKCLAMHMGTLKKYRHLRTDDAWVWEAIKFAKETGCQWFSFRGVGSSPTEKRFKSKFRPEVVSLIGYYDLPFNPLIYRFFSLAEFKILPRIWRILMTLRRIVRGSIPF